MKNITLIIMLISANLLYSQIYPLNTSPGDVPNGAYIKDTNNELDKYVGVWSGNWNGKTVMLELKKVKQNYDNYFFMDKIVGERKIINPNGVTEIDRITNFDTQNSEFKGIYKSIKYPGKYRLDFYPKNMCGKTGVLEIMNFTNSTMTLHFEYLPSIFDPNCIHNAYVDQHDDFPINFPKDIILTKQ